MITIDGSLGEGGGQVLRTSLTMAMLTRQPVRLTHIRAGRSKPGLAPQHLAGLLAAAEICRASVDGAHFGSTDVTFQPGGSPMPGQYVFDIGAMAGRGSAGAVTLLLQAILLPLALAESPSTLTIRGGTHVPWSPPAHYVQFVLLPVLAQIGVEASFETTRWGWYPQGEGEVLVTLRGGAKLNGIDLSQRGRLIGVEGLAVASNLASDIPQRIASRANNRLREAGLPGSVSPLRTGGKSTGVGLSIALIYEHARAGFNSLGKKGKPSPVVADDALDLLLAFHDQAGALDLHLADQIIPALAVAQGPSRLTTEEITLHTLTNVAVIGHFTRRKIVVDGQEGEPGAISIAPDEG
jgi:RNA 3'-terminal phosphate cyclase (ATP)